MRVLFPAPFSPRRAWTVPRSTRKLMRSLAVREPKVLVMPSISSIRQTRGGRPVLERTRGDRPASRLLLLELAVQHHLLRLGDLVLDLLRHLVAELAVPGGLLVLDPDHVRLALELAGLCELRDLEHADVDVLDGARQDRLGRQRVLVAHEADREHALLPGRVDPALL